MKIKHLKRFLDSFDNEEAEIFLKLKYHYDPGKHLPFSEGKIEALQEQFKNARLDFNSIDFVMSDQYPESAED